MSRQERQLVSQASCSEQQSEGRRTESSASVQSPLTTTMARHDKGGPLNCLVFDAPRKLAPAHELHTMACSVIACTAGRAAHFTSSMPESNWPSLTCVSVSLLRRRLGHQSGQLQLIRKQGVLLLGGRSEGGRGVGRRGEGRGKGEERTGRGVLEVEVSEIE